MSNRDTTGYKRITLAPAKIRAGYEYPTISRRGGVKLRPVEDGLANPTRQLEVPLFRDTFGNKLIDVISTETGFCRGVRSTGFSAANNRAGISPQPGVSGGHNTETKRAEYTRTSKPGIWLGEENRVMRTVSMGDDPLPGRPRERDTQTPKKEGTRKMAPVPAARGRRPPAPRPTITDDDCRNLIHVMAKGNKVGVITPSMMKLARKILTEKYAAMIKQTTGKRKGS